MMGQMISEMLNSILEIHALLPRNKQYCHTYELSIDILNNWDSWCVQISKQKASMM
jgi:hypothetical protein